MKSNLRMQQCIGCPRGHPEFGGRERPHRSFLFPILGALVAMGILANPTHAQHSQYSIRPAQMGGGPAVATPPDPSTWSVEVLGRLEIAERRRAEEAARSGEGTDPVLADPDAPAPVERRPPAPVDMGDVVRINHSYSKNLHWMETETRGGDRQRMFIVGGYLVFDSPFRDEVVVLSPRQAAEEQLNYRAGRFEDFTWVSAGNYKGVTTFQGRECDVFQLTAADTDAVPVDPLVQEQEAYGLETIHVLPPTARARERSKQEIVRTALVDRETRLPVLLEDRHSIQIYKFIPTKKGIELPKRYFDALKEHYELSQARQRRYNVPQ